MQATARDDHGGRPLAAALCTALALLAPVAAAAELAVAAVFSDHAVLQRGRPVPVWGRASPGTTVAVVYGEHRVDTVTDGTGRWLARLPAMPASSVPQTLNVTAGGETRSFADVVIGEVWFAAGQSNMEWRLVHSDGGRRLLERADNPYLRFLLAEPDCAAAPRPDAMPAWRKEGEPASWQPNRPWSANRMGAVPYYMGAALQRELGVPVGIIQAAVGGSRIEAWMPREAFAGPAFVAERAWLVQADALHWQQERDALKAYEAWFAALPRPGPEGRVPPPPPWPHSPGAWYNKPTCFYNGMIHGLTPYALAGLAWYQGESNVPEAERYAPLLEAFIAAMRRAWQHDSLPVALVQLAPYAHPVTDKLPRLWQAQLMAARGSDIGLVTLSDLVDDMTDLHPPNKRDVGERLARWALYAVYGRSELLPTGPLYRHHVVEGDRIQIVFDHARGLKTALGGPVRDFEIAGSDGRFLPATAVIDGEAVLVGHSAVPRPRAVRFAWRPTAQPNLVNADLLPAAAFSTADER
jgi:sialate O-acetylesterase